MLKKIKEEFESFKQEIMNRIDQTLKAEIEKNRKEESKELQVLKEALIEMRLEQYRFADQLIPIEHYTDGDLNEIENYWTGHTVLDNWFLTAKESIAYCQTRFSLYPFFKEMAKMDKCHDDEIILDYGCGPGNDLVWYSYHNRLKKIIGMDVSATALRNAQYRLALMGIQKEKARLMQISDQEVHLPLEDETVDFISCQGVLMHTSNPQEILKEFYRVLKKKNKKLAVSIMVYNKESIWWHLYAAYYLRYINDSIFNELPEKVRKNMSLEEIFRRSTDGVHCAKADCYTREEFTEMCKTAGFSKIVFGGGYPNMLEPDIAQKYIRQALKDSRLEEEHKQFLRKVKFDKNGFPRYEGKHCCIGGVYLLYC